MFRIYKRGISAKNSEVISTKFNVVRICTGGGISAEIRIAKFYHF
jgi:hypothetical protein